jgi:signal transduction histidine kinase
LKKLTNRHLRVIVLIGVILMFIFMASVFGYQYQQYKQLQRTLANTYQSTPTFHHEIDYLRGKLGEANLLFRYYTVEFDPEIYMHYLDNINLVQGYVDSLASLPIDNNPLLTDSILWDQHLQFANEFAVLKLNLEQLLMLSSTPIVTDVPNNSSKKQLVSTPLLDRHSIVNTETNALADTVVIQRKGLIKRIFQSKPDTVIVPKSTISQAQTQKIERIHQQVQTELEDLSKSYEKEFQQIQITFRKLQEKDRQLLLTHFELLDQIESNLEQLNKLQEQQALAKTIDELQLYQNNSKDFENQLAWAMVAILLLITLLLIYHFYANRFEVKLLQERELANQNADIKTNLLAEISHEIRTPLNCLLEVTEQLQSQADWIKQPHLKELLEAANYTIQISNQNVQDILHLSKIESGQAEAKLEGFYIVRLLQDVILIHQNQLKHKDIQLFSQIDIPQEQVLSSDAFRIRQIVSNFLSNAIKYTQQGSIYVRARIVSTHKKHMLNIEVEDTGPGMTNDQIELIFRKYYTIQKHLGSGGTGIGLYLSKLFVNQLKGQIGVKSTVGKGSTFHVQVPVEVLKEPPLYCEVRSIKDLPSTLVILIVDDQPINHLIMKPLLAHFEQVYYAHNGSQALDLIKTHSIDVVLTDIIMPMMDGWEVLKQIKDLSIQDAPKWVIALSADVLLAEQNADYEGYTFDGILPKPPSESALASSLIPLLEEHSVQITK